MGGTSDMDIHNKETALSGYGDLLQLLTELRDYFEPMADAEYLPNDPAPVPNQEMKFLCQIEEALADLECK